MNLFSNRTNFLIKLCHKTRAPSKDGGEGLLLLLRKIVMIIIVIMIRIIIIVSICYNERKAGGGAKNGTKSGR